MSADDRIKAQILSGTRLGGKTYAFDDEHDERIPADLWFQESHEGRILFLVFYSQACRWSRCLGCSLPSKMASRHIPYRSLMEQIDWVFRQPPVQESASEIRKVIASNNGSMLDQKTFSSTALIYLLAQLNRHLPNLATLAIETRPEYVDLPELEFLARALVEGDTPTQLEIAIGFEAFDDRIRNEVYNKGLPLHTFEQFVERVAPYGYRIKCYFMQKPVPEMSDEEAIHDVQNAIDYLSQVAGERGVPINMHLSPTYVAAGTLLEEAFRRGDYRPPLLVDVAEAARRGRDRSLTLFIGLSDENMAIEGGSFLRPGEEETVEKLEAFNRTQNFDILDAVCTHSPSA